MCNYNRRLFCCFTIDGYCYKVISIGTSEIQSFMYGEILLNNGLLNLTIAVYYFSYYPPVVIGCHNSPYIITIPP